MTRYAIGAWVHVQKTVAAVYKGNLRTLEAHKADWHGQVVGATRMQVGTRYPGSTYVHPEDGVDPPTFTLRKVIFVWLVRRGITNKAQRVLPQHLIQVQPPGSGLPLYFNPDPGGWKQHRAWLAADKHFSVGVDGEFSACGIRHDTEDIVMRWANSWGSVTCQACLECRRAEDVEEALLKIHTLLPDGLCESCAHGMTIPNECAVCGPQ